MIRVSAKAVAIAVGIAFAAAAPAQAGHHCVKAGGKSVGVLPDIVKADSVLAVNDSIKKNGWKAAGKVSTSCSTKNLLTTCVSSRRACK